MTRENIESGTIAAAASIIGSSLVKEVAEMSIKGVGDAYRIQTANSIQRKNEKSEVGSSGESKNNFDRVDISSQAMFRAQVASAGKSFANAASEQVSAQRISALAQKYAGESCPVEGGAIAESMIARIIGE